MSGSKKVLILGSAGQLGAALVRCFGKSCEVVPLSHEQLDVCDGSRVQQVQSAEKPWAVINAAACTDVDGCEKNVEKAYTVNAIAAGNIAEQAAKNGSTLVHISTDYVFDGFKDTPYQEQDEPNPLSIYAKSKLEGERLVSQAMPKALIVRSAWLFGMGRSNFVMRIFESVMTKPEIPVVSDHWGSPTYTEDLATAVEKLLARDAIGLFHVTNQGNCSWYEYAVEILKILKIRTCKIVPVSGDELKRPASRPVYSVLDNSRYQGVVGELLRPWKEALADFLGSLNKDLNPSDVWSS